MIYFDAAYVAKCYLNEPGADRVREVAYGADGLARECHVTRREMRAILKDFEEDEQNGVWQWFGVTCRGTWLSRGLHERPPHVEGRAGGPSAKLLEASVLFRV